MRDSILEPHALNLARGQFGTCFNGQTFQIDAVVTFGGWQYATYVDHKRRVCVARRELPDGPWQSVPFDDYTIDHADVHNVPVIGICPADGTIHLAFDHHVSPLHYRVSELGAATSPARADWSAGLFGATTSELIPGHTLDRLTYPNFVTTPGGGLLLYYRIGGSGDGDSHLARYRPERGGWSVDGEFVSRRGRFGDSPSRSAYHNGFDFGPGGRLHTTWLWREDPGLLSNHDLQYAYSDDEGRTWRNNDGASIGVTGRAPMHLASPRVTVRALPHGWGLMNQVTQTVDSRGRVHVVLWQRSLDEPTASTDLSTWRYVHYWRDDEGRWRHQELPFAGRKPSLVADADDNLVLVFTKPDRPDYHGLDTGGPLHVATAAAADGWETWHAVQRSEVAFVGEPRIDEHRWRDEQVLSVYAQRAPGRAGEPSELHVIDLEQRC
ncbi:hypothetical protein E1262_15670 [Jiangella aurantiaca]|uniref:Neuraminidase n=1 Tax=Jiangella aurantiaca TaxID=2530373 RepID=A0A4R5A8V2_9ACTN|nr:BNR repeat-containing protein [Jiangella aurantiaca]TDD68461.1 hypothetical protein E1262_15670 [Jiangella aurantiaca]